MVKVMCSRGLCQPQTLKNKTLRGTMKNKIYKKFSCLVEISSTLQQLWTDLLEKGRALQKLLDVEYPGADAVCSAVGEIHLLLDCDDICDVWISAHIKVGDGKIFISNQDVRKVSILLIACLDCMNMHLLNQSFSLLRWRCKRSSTARKRRLITSSLIPMRGR